MYKCDVFDGLSKEDIQMDTDIKVPKLYDWEFLNITNTFIRLKVNFTDPLLVSSFEQPDKLDIVFLMP